ncbi:protein-L-isoaspartate(D-aspartate) O-methyltransferase [Collimonas sp. OK307]|uniref:protein-L-isoaspartate(D-aspartate) O-methyltransferase n=1 Tax=Collimonas sp. OK307 TaxID=1801620 RepID=UPI0008E2B667|nr:protein-L-isoaspartate(D-aspartate) O-methyltransferase [Collimonas sp. OK307]SFI10594.1 protein-L-isoaspartate(D-aspartate) O-methyltransferase [Collimonas sp. OK307]
MTDKAKRFPLTLSSVVDQKSKTDHSKRSVATPQTATKNAAWESSRPVPVPRTASGAAPAPSVNRSMARPAQTASHVERSDSMVSDGVRKAMVDRVARQGVNDARVLAAMEAVPRHMFMEPGLSSQAYIDASLPIGHHQTISQPYIVARMIEIMRDNQQGGVLNRVLEIGTGCGYQAAVLSLVAKEVYSIERIKPLHELARSNLRPLRIANIRLHYGDGMLGLPQVAPFDGIILAAAGLEVPQALLDQLTIGGRLVAPVGSRHQVLQLIQRTSKFDWTSTTLEDCHFVPLRAGTV